MLRSMASGKHSPQIWKFRGVYLLLIASGSGLSCSEVLALLCLQLTQDQSSASSPGHSSWHSGLTGTAHLQWWAGDTLQNPGPSLNSFTSSPSYLLYLFSSSPPLLTKLQFSYVYHASSFLLPWTSALANNQAWTETLLPPQALITVFSPSAKLKNFQEILAPAVKALAFSPVAHVTPRDCCVG